MYIVQYSVAAILFRIVHITATCGFDVAYLITPSRDIKVQISKAWGDYFLKKS